MRYPRLAAAALVVAMLLGTTPAAADRGRVVDGDDTEGFLDVRSLSHRHGYEGRLRHTVVTHGAWRSRRLKRECGTLELVFKRPGKSHRVVRVFYDGGLKGEMVDHAGDEPRVIGMVNVRRRDDHTVVVTFKRRMLGAGVDTYRWGVVTETYRGGCPTPPGDPQIYNDFAPNDGYLTHRLT